ncbi:E3 ubiquitin-protein ligase ATL42-like [Magnolia sinica]|uniref:E3 ubiquitin-protein ligase ATL42-like n=1 Tax=Magnolia sinica TaxID=86752 RepID=UPI00265B674D|nr:E3 ubiquitin-protein ligase ATL42-like [Magnolia sinica]
MQWGPIIIKTLISKPYSNLTISSLNTRTLLHKFISRDPRIPSLPRSSAMINGPNPLMDLPFLFFIFLSLFHTYVRAQANQPDLSDQNAVPSTYRPSVAVVIGIIAIMVSLTFLLFVYAKFCHISASDFFNHGETDQNGPNQLRSRFSGIDKSVIDRLPFFQFSSLKGAKEGLECAVCLSKFEETDLLRLLPKCKHAFHIDCIGQWLESHSSCPLCRYKVDVQDLNTITYSNSLRFLRDPSDLREPDLELFVEREPDSDGTSSRFSIGGSFRIIDKGKKEEFLIPENGDEDPQFLHKFKHKIVVSDVVLKNRWSDVNSSDLMALNSEMLNDASSKRFSSLDSTSDHFLILEDGSFVNERTSKMREEMDKKRLLESKVSGININLPSTSTSTSLIPSGKRSMSEITNISRFMDFGAKNRIKDPSTGGNNAKEEKVRKLWLPIARRTVQWFAGREQRSGSKDEKEISNV